jgi:hypothetical protein
MSAPVLPSAKMPSRAGKKEFQRGMDWKSFFKKTIVIVFLFSLAVHILLLIGFGGVTLFQGRIPTPQFTAQNTVSEEAATPIAPPEEEMVQEEKTADPNMPDETPAAEDSAPPLEMMTLPGGASWAPAVPKDIKMSTTGSFGGSGAGAGAGTGTGKGMGRTAGLKLFGVEVKAKKLGVIVSINKAVQNSGRLPKMFEEIFKQFPDADVILTNGGGMVDWPQALAEFNSKVEDRKKREKETGKKEFGPSKMDVPKVTRFNSGEAMDWPPVRGVSFDKEYPGLKAKEPELYEKLLKRNNTWFLTSYADANACYKAFDELIKKRVEAIYWYNSFSFPIEGSEADRVASVILENKIEIIVDDQVGSFKNGKEWIQKVQAKTASRGPG